MNSISNRAQGEHEGEDIGDTRTTINRSFSQHFLVNHGQHPSTGETIAIHSDSILRLLRNEIGNEEGSMKWREGFCDAPYSAVMFPYSDRLPRGVATTD